VELLETTPITRRQKMIDVGMIEDPEYTQRAIELMFNFEDVLNLNLDELAEVLADAHPRMVAYAIKPFSEEVRTKFLRCARPNKASEIRDFLDMNIGKREIGGAQLKLVEYVRAVERAGLLKKKRIPT
jgi:flagellar motor switch protein FliG